MFKKVLGLLRRIASGEITLRRFFNRLFISCSRSLGLRLLPPLPSELIVEPTNICNIQCPLCPTGAKVMSRPRGMMTKETFRRILREAASTLMHLYLSHFGEPFLHPQLCEWIRLAKQKRIPRIMLSTNAIPLSNADLAMRLVESGLDHLIVSIDGVTSTTYLKFRKGGDFDKCVQGIKNVVTAKKRLQSKTPYVDLQFIVTKHNESELDAMRELAGSLGADHLSFRNCAVGLDVKEFRDLLPEYLPKTQENLVYTMMKTPEAEIPRCEWFWKKTVILWNGDLVPCCNDWDGKFPMGNINRESLARLWKGKKLMAFRKKIMENRRSFKMCSVCLEGYGEWYYDF